MIIQQHSAFFILFTNIYQTLSFQSCDELNSIVRCEIETPKIPISTHTVIPYLSLTERQCISHMQMFKWNVGLFCPSSEFCGLGIDFGNHYRYQEATEFKPLQEVCHVLVNRELTSCGEAEADLSSTGMLRSKFHCKDERWLIKPPQLHISLPRLLARFLQDFEFFDHYGDAKQL